jgi:hypothetical protein
MKRNIFLAGMLVLVFGLVVIGCGDGAGGGQENTDPKKITITGLDGQTGEIGVELFLLAEGGGAGGEGTIDNNSVTVSLKKGKVETGVTDWTGTGSYYLAIGIINGSHVDLYVYTNGKTLADLGIFGEDDLEKLPKINIIAANTTVPFSKFQFWEAWED